MSSENPSPVPEDIFNTITLKEIDTLAGKLNHMDEAQRNALLERVYNSFSNQDRQLTIELLVLQKRIFALDYLEQTNIQLSDEEFEKEMSEYRDILQQKRGSLFAPDATFDSVSDDIPYNRSVFPDGLPIGEENEPIETEQSKFFAFLTERIQAGLISFGENGKPQRKAMDDSIMLHYRPEEARKRGIIETPLLEESPREPLNEVQKNYVDMLQWRVVIASGHTDFRLPYEASMHKIVRQLDKENTAPTQ